MKTRLKKKKRSAEELQTFADWQAGRWHSQLPEYAMRCAMLNPSADNLYLALKILHALRGPDTESLAALEGQMSQSEHQFFWSSLSLRLLCVHLQSGHKQAAHAVIQRYMPDKPSLIATFRVRRFPMALAFLAEHYGELLNDTLQQKAILAQTLLKRKKSVDERLFPDLCSNQSDNNAKQVSVAVVGNAPSLLDQAQGRSIDEHDVVVRFNSPVLTEKYQVYSGRRTDVWVVSPELARQAPMPSVHTKIVSGINILAGESGYWQQLARHSMDVQLALFRQEIWYQLVSKLHAPPTAGLLMLTSLARTRGLRVTAFGFSGNGNKLTGNAASCQAPNQHTNHYADRRPASTRHNWAAEAQLLTEWYRT